MTPLHLSTTAEVRDLASQLAVAPAVAFDTEFLWERTYRPQLCLVQVATDGVEATVDPLAGADLASLWAALAGAPTLVVHAGAHDLDLLHHASGRLASQVFDTQIAGAFLGFGESAGYGNLVQAALERRVQGGETYTDWSRRPLKPEQIAYAGEDVRHLLDLWRDLASRLERLRRTTWADDETRRRFATVGEAVDPHEQWRRVSDARKVKGRSLAVLREVAAWREIEAERRDEGRQRLVPDRVLIEVARRAPTDPAAIAALRGLHPGQAKVVARPLAEAVRAALAIPEAEWPRWPQARPFAADPRVDAAASLLHAVVRSRAGDMDLAPGLLGSRSDLEELARLAIAGELDQAESPLLSGWRRAAAGEELLRVLRGEVAVRVGERARIELG